jgi:hypothetical protein
MHVSKDALPMKVVTPAATARQLPDFGTASGPLGAEYFTMATGVDMAPLLAGLKDDACPSAHWGYVITGEVVVTYTDGTIEACTDGELFYWPPGHTVRVEREAELILFSPQHDHGPVLDHVNFKLASV